MISAYLTWTENSDILKLKLTINGCMKNCRQNTIFIMKFSKKKSKHKRYVIIGTNRS